MDKTLEAQAHGLSLICTTPRISPKRCPVCGDSPPRGDFKTLALAMEAHILKMHPPQTPLHQACVARQAAIIGGKPPIWGLDWDVVRHGRCGDRLYFCVPCGFYAPDVVQAEQLPSD